MSAAVAGGSAATDRLAGLVPADAHIHLFETSFDDSQAERHPEGELAHYESLRRQYSISDALVIGYEGDARFAGNNEYVRRLSESRSWIRPMAHVVPSADGDRAAVLVDRGFVGLSIYVDPVESASGDWKAWAADVLAAAGALDVPVSLNAPAASHSTVMELLDGRRDVRVMLSHLGLPGPGPDPGSPELAATRELLTEHGCWVKLSGTYAGAPVGERDPNRATVAWVDWLLDRVGPTRLMWGSDFSPALGRMTFEETILLPSLAAVGTSELEQIYGGNLRALLRSSGRLGGSS
ncbi:hypothetical protein D1871_07825 [Nakamurella silvestris]|nr:hypothetical protein D1871_07825 [Nakamurella silvestris]